MVQHSAKMMEYVEEFAPKKSLGLEIAPYFDPCISKQSHDILYTDYIDNETIAAKAQENPGTRGKDLPEVDFVWRSGEALAACVPDGRRFDYILASHVMEHVPDPVGWLNQLLSVMHVGGKLILFLPNRYYNVDCYRTETSFAQLVAWWIEQSPHPTKDQVLDFMTSALDLRHNDGTQWDEVGFPVIKSAPFYSDKDSIDTAIAIHGSSSYLDIHCSVWTVASLQAHIARLTEAGILNVKVERVHSEESEFLCILEKAGEPSRFPPNKSVYERFVRQEGATLSAMQHELSVLRHDLSFLIAKIHRERPLGVRAVGVVRRLVISVLRACGVIKPKQRPTPNPLP
jgi:Methyltransferase domain